MALFKAQNFSTRIFRNLNLMRLSSLNIASKSTSIKKPRVVTIMGHVDHGKTTLLPGHAAFASMGMPVGLGEENEPNPNVKAFVDQIKPMLEARTNTKYEYIEPLTYKSQIVSGKNYFVKAKAKAKDSDERIVHLRIYHQPWTDTLELTAYKFKKSKKEELKWFQ